MKEFPIVMISSTTLDLPEYRGQVRDACLRASAHPSMMEQLPALDADAICVSRKMVDEADVYVGIFAHRYGHIPVGHHISITEMEYERAVDLGIPRLIFLMHEDVALRATHVDKGEKGEKLDKLKERLKAERKIAFFKNPEDLRGQVVDSLNELKKRGDSVASDGRGQQNGETLAKSLHYVSEIPHPPEPYIAHLYTLLQVRSLVGRKDELEMLTDWVTGDPRYADARIFNVVAIGGMGKSALTWTWFNDIAPQEMSPLTGRLWWSFYESDATFENFVTRALVYVARSTLDDVRKFSFPEREDQLFRILDQKPFLLVLDGLERLLIAYDRPDAAYLEDKDALEETTTERVAGTLGIPASAERSFVGRYTLRKTADPRAGRFLRRLAQVQASRTLISTRLYPADLQAPGGNASPGCFAHFLTGLSDQDALDLWRVYGARGSREEMLPIFRTFENHPLLLQLLAYEVADFHEAPGDFDAWRRASPNFNPFVLRLANVQSHVLAFALSGLSAAERRTLRVIAGFRMPASMETIRELLVCVEEDEDVQKKPFSRLRELDEALTALEDRGLLGWDRRGNRYDLHPIVRGVVWSELDDISRMALYGTLRDHFEAISTPDYLDVNSLSDLTPAIELYNNLIRLQRYDEASQVFQDRLDKATHFRLSASRLRVELLEALFPNGRDGSPVLSGASLSSTLNSLAMAYNLSGRPGAAVTLLTRADEIDVQEDDQESRSIGLGNLADALRLSGRLRAGEAHARKALILARADGSRILEGASLSHLGLALVARGKLTDATRAFRRALRVWRREGLWQSDGWISAYLAEVALGQGDAATAQAYADRAWEIAETLRNERELIHAARLKGTALLRQKQFVPAGERLHHALLRARTVSLIEEELPLMVALADWHRQQGQTAEALAMLDDVWDAAARGPFPLFHADALNVLAQIERDAGTTEAAVEAAVEAYRLTWCNGPPFAYHLGLEKAKAHLAVLGAPEPEMPPLDESQHEPMPDVEINPPDEFGGDGDDEQAE